MKNALIYLIVFVAVQLGIGSGVNEIWKLASGSPDINPTMLIVSMSATSIVTLAVFLTARWAPVSKSYVRSRPWTVLVWSSLAALGAIVPSSWLQEQMPDLPNVMNDVFNMILRDRWGYLAVGLLAPVAEELVFRGAILRSLLAWKPERHWLGIVVTALLFALVHGNPAQMPHAFLVGLLLGWMYYRTGSIVPCVAYHWVNNTLAYIIYNMMPDPNAQLLTLFGGSQLRVILALVFSLCILVPSIIQLNASMKKAEV